MFLRDALEEHLRRYHTRDGNCLQCRRPADRHHPVGPITITVSEPDDCGESLTHEFCEWRCFAHWTAVQAGGDFVVNWN